MDFLDSLDLESQSTHTKKSHRMQSWYMYEQYKSLERNQTEAAQKLKGKSYQDRILHQEMAERRARRRLYDEPGCQSESGIESIKSDEKSCVIASNDDFFESFCEIHSEEEISRTDNKGLECGEISRDSSRDLRPGSQLSNRLMKPFHLIGEDMIGFRTTTKINPIQKIDDFITGDPDTSETVSRQFWEKWNTEEYKDTEDSNDDNTYPESVNTFVLNENQVYNTKVSRDNLADDIKEELEFVKKNIAENINLQLETVKENMQCLEDFTRFRDFDQLSNKYDFECDSVYSTEDSIQSQRPRNREVENNVLAMWSKLVSFAYRVMHLNHGNCYYDYSSQFLTAVLACDVLRMGVNKICNILQPYVTPIKFVTDVSETEIVKLKCHKHVKRKKCIVSKKSPKNFQSKFHPHRQKTPTKLCRCVRHCLFETPSTPCGFDTKQSENSWGQYIFKNRIKEKTCRIFSEPLRSVAKSSNIIPSEKTSCTMWPEEYFLTKSSDENLSSCHKRVANPMLKLANYIDEIFQEIEYSKHM